MKISLSNDSLLQAKVDLLAIGVRAKKITKDENVAKLDKAMSGALIAHVEDEDFQAKAGQVLKVPARGRVAAKWIVLVGLGELPPSPLDARLVAVKACVASRKHRSVGLVLPAEDLDAVRAGAEGLTVGPYRFDRYLTGPRKPKDSLKSGTILVAGKSISAEQKAALEQGSIVGQSINLARDLVNAPPNDLTPTALANAAKQAATESGISCTVWGPKEMEKKGMSLFLAVARGSGQEPRVAHMVYKPAGAKKKIVFVGKGLTFDSGGLCIKPAKAMIDMKCDMAGAAATIGIVMAAAKLKLNVEVHGLIGATENMSGDHAYRPGDVFPTLDGKTVEIINTDAEGRLVLADVLAYARELEPDYLIDHATLTGACMVALGPWTAGMYANDEAFAAGYTDAAKVSGESFWRLPLLEDLRETLSSDIADLKHTGDAYGGSISAALFLREFVGKAKWVHCDIAGPAFLERAHGESPKGGTGFGVSTGVRFVEQIARG